MALNPFIGQTQTQLETWLRQAQTDLAAGKTVSQATGGDASMQNLVQMTPQERIDKLLFALNLLDPVLYPSSGILRVTRTKLLIADGDY